MHEQRGSACKFSTAHPQARVRLQTYQDEHRDAVRAAARNARLNPLQHDEPGSPRGHATDAHVAPVDTDREARKAEKAARKKRKRGRSERDNGGGGGGDGGSDDDGGVEAALAGGDRGRRRWEEAEEEETADERRARLEREKCAPRHVCTKHRAMHSNAQSSQRAAHAHTPCGGGTHRPWTSLPSRSDCDTCAVL